MPDVGDTHPSDSLSRLGHSHICPQKLQALGPEVESGHWLTMWLAGCPFTTGRITEKTC